MATQNHPRTAALASKAATRFQTGNSFLDALSDESAATVLPQLVPLTLPLSKVIANSGTAVDLILFPRRSVISAVTRMRDGTDIEVTLIGREGFHGLQAILGDGTSSSEAMVQLANSAYSMQAADFVQAVHADRALMDRALRYAQFSLETIAQFSGCNRLHQIHERCARWLLMVHDRVVDDELHLTHEFLATMLGVRRPGVTLAAQTLDRAGLIEYSRGRILVKNRPGLELVACECYEQSNEVLDRLLGYSIRNR